MRCKLPDKILYQITYVAACRLIIMNTVTLYDHWYYILGSSNGSTLRVMTSVNLRSNGSKTNKLLKYRVSCNAK